MSLRVLRHGEATARCLVVLLHGVGANADDLIDLAPMLAPALPGVAFAAFDAPEPYDMAPFGRQWFSLADRTPARLLAGVEAVTPVLDAALDGELAHVGADRLALLGFSQGAMVALHAGLRRVRSPAAILAYSGALIAPPPMSAASVLLVHGIEDEVVPPARSRSAEAALRAAGVSVEAMYRPGLGHSIDGPGLSAGSELLRRAFQLV